MSRKKTTGDRYKLGEPVAGKLSDFCAANFNPPEIEVIRVALDQFIESELERNEGMRERYVAARKKRMDGDGKVAKIRPVKD